MPSIKEQLIKVSVSRDLIDKFTPEEQRELYSKIIKYNNNKFATNIEFSQDWQLDLLLGKFSAIQERSDLDSLKDSRGYGIQHYIAWSGHIEALTWLYDNHTELCVKEAYAHIAHFAALSGNPELLKLIKSKNPELLTKTTIKNVSIAHWAGFSGTRATFDWIHENCPDVLTIKTVDGCTAGHTAAWAGNASAVKVFEAHCPEQYEEKATNQWTIEDFANSSGDSNTIITAKLGSINFFNNTIRRLQNEPSFIFVSTNPLILNKISALEALRDILFNKEGYNYNELRAWYGIHGAAIEAQRNIFHAFFVPGHQSTTEKFVLGIFKMLNIDVNQVKSTFLDRDEGDSDHANSFELTN